jgi:hypothetical protein
MIFFLRERRFDRWRIDDSIRISLGDRQDSSGAAGGRLIGDDTHLFVLSSQWCRVAWFGIAGYRHHDNIYPLIGFWLSTPYYLRLFIRIKN